MTSGTLTEQTMTFALTAVRSGPESSTSSVGVAHITLDTSVTGNPEALNPMELLMSALGACFLKGIERFAPTLPFSFSAAEVRITAERPVNEARVTRIDYAIVVATSEDDRRLELLHKNLLTFGTMYNTISPGTPIAGTLTRA